MNICAADINKPIMIRQILSVNGLCLILVGTGACTRTSEPPSIPESPHNESQGVVLTESQVTRAGIQTARVELRELAVSLPANGVLDVPPQSRISVSPPVGGFIRQTELLQGMKVQKGQVLAVLEHPDYIQLQQDYIDSQSQLIFLGQEKERQQILARDNVNAAKSLQQAEAQYLSMKAKTDGLAARLQLLGLDPAVVSAGPLTSSIRITSPITGYVTDVHVNLGKYAASDEVMFELVDTRHLHAELQVFESDLARLRIGQRVWVKLLNEEAEREATVYLIGREISASRTVQVHCHFKDHDEHLVPGMYFSARIETTLEQRWVLPAEAVVHLDGKPCVFVRTDDGSFALKEIAAYEPVAGLAAVEGLSPEDEVVVKGTFYLLSTLRGGDEDH